MIRPGASMAIAMALLVAVVVLSARSVAAGLRLTLLPAGTREAIVIDLEDDLAVVATLPSPDDRTVRIEIGPLRGAAAPQRWEAPASATLVREIRAIPSSTPAVGDMVILQIATKQRVNASVRQSRRRLYIDVTPAAVAPAMTARAAARPAAPAAVPAPPSTTAPVAAAAPRAATVANAPPVSAPAPTAVPLVVPPARMPIGPPSEPAIASLAADALAALLPTIVERPPAQVPVARPILAAHTLLPWTTLIEAPPPLERPPLTGAPAATVARPETAAADARSPRPTDVDRTRPGNRPTGAPTWPAPPAAARIRFVRSLNPRSVRGRPSPLSRLVTALTGSRSEPTMTQPYGIAVGPDQRVYVADTDGGVIHVYNVGKSGYSTIKLEAQSLIGIVFLGERLVVTDSEAGRVICIDQKGREVWSLGRRQGFERPTGIAAGGDRVYVVDTMRHKVVIVSAAGQVIDTFGSRGSAPGQFNFPTNIARGRDGRLFVTDAMNFRVQVFDATGQPQQAFGRLGDASGDFEKPKGIALDSAGHVYVVEGLHDVVQIFDDAGQLLLSFGGSGAGDGQLWLPSGIAIANDVVYVADSSNRRVQMFEYLGGVR